MLAAEVLYGREKQSMSAEESPGNTIKEGREHEDEGKAEGARRLG